MSTTSSALQVSSSYYHPSVALEVNESSTGNFFTDTPNFDAEANVGSGSISYYGFTTTQFFGIGLASPPTSSYGSGVTFTPGVGSAQYYDEFGPSNGINYWMSSNWYKSNPSKTQAFKTNLPALNSEGQYYLTMASGTGGSVSPSSGYYDAGQQVQITATANAHYAFSSWSGSGSGSYSGSANPATITMNGNIQETANFVATQYYLTMTAGTGGSVSPSSGWYNVGAQVQISATANSGYHFSSWSGSGSGSYSGTGNPATVTMNGAITETANFAPNQYYLTMTAGTGGSVSPSSGYYNAGQQVQISATPNSGYHFVSWSGSGSGSYSGSSNPATVTINGNIQETANFAINQYYLTMQIGGGGVGSVSPSSGYYNAGSQVTIQAYPGTGYKFCGWTGSGSVSYTGSSNPSSVTMNSAITETATIKLQCLNGPSLPSSGSVELPLLAVIGLFCLLPMNRPEEILYCPEA